MLNASKKTKLINSLKSFTKKYFSKEIEDLDESGTRLLINDLLRDVLHYEQVSEIKTEYMIKGTYADYVVQTNGIQNFLVEVKALSLKLSAKHLRQTIEYGANEGIEWAILTNGRDLELYRILFNKPIESKLIFRIDLGDKTQIKYTADCLEYLHKEAVIKKGLNFLWNRFTALETTTIAGLLFSPSVTNFLKRELKRKFKSKFDEKEIREALTCLLTEAIDIEKVKMPGIKRTSKPIKKEGIKKLDESSIPETEENLLGE
jgi:hypothetical protein